MFNKNLKKIGISMLTLAALTMGRQEVFASSQVGIKVAQNDNLSTTCVAATTLNAEEAIKSLKALVTKDTKIYDKASGKMINVSDADSTKPETLDAIIEALVKEGKITKAITVDGLESGINVAKPINDEDAIRHIKELISKDTMYYDKLSEKMINASDADLTKPETLNAVIEALAKEGKITKAVTAETLEIGDTN